MASGAAAGAPSNPANEHALAIQEAEQLGRAIFEHDRAAWVSTDVLVEMFGDSLASKIGGWVEMPTEKGVRVLYFSPDASRPVYAVDVRKGSASRKDVIEYGADAEFTPAERALVDARQLALRQEFQACSRHYNTVTLQAAGGGYFVYLLAATTDPRVSHFGGHYRFHVAASGAEVLGFQKYTNACLALPRKGPAGEIVAALMVTQLLTQHPTEVHVWKSLELGFDIIVLTPNRAMWEVSKGEIEFVRMLDETTASADALLQAASLAPAADECLARLAARSEEEASCADDARVFAPERGIRELTPMHLGVDRP